MTDAVWLVADGVQLESLPECNSSGAAIYAYPDGPVRDLGPLQQNKWYIFQYKVRVHPGELERMGYKSYTVKRKHFWSSLLRWFRHPHYLSISIPVRF